jgi:hypothetical protein
MAQPPKGRPDKISELSNPEIPKLKKFLSKLSKTGS